MKAQESLVKTGGLSPDGGCFFTIYAM